MTRINSACVIGAGFAGLSAALELAQAGITTTVFEAALTPGGRAHVHQSPDGRFRFDMGPTIITMIEELRRALGEDAFGSLQLQRLEPGYRVLWPDGAHFDMHSDIGLWLAEIMRYRADGAADAMAYLASVYEQFREAKSLVLDNPWTARSFARMFAGPPRLRPWVLGSLRKYAERAFVHPRLVDAATFQTLYLGLAPSRSPAMYALLMAQEVVDGVWYARGGTAGIIDALVAECRRRGVTFHFGARASHVTVRNKRATAVSINGETIAIEGAVIASDREPALRTMFGARERRRIRYGHSALVFAIGFDVDLPLPHHTVLLPGDPWKSYNELDRGRVPDDILVYCAYPSATDATATRGALTALVPVPNRSQVKHLNESALLRKVLERIESHFGPLAKQVAYVNYIGPKQFESKLGLQFGAAFGPDHDLLQMGPLRPSLDCPAARNVVFAGAGTRPGSGVPLALLSGKLAAQRLLERR